MTSERAVQFSRTHRHELTPTARYLFQNLVQTAIPWTQKYLTIGEALPDTRCFEGGVPGFITEPLEKLGSSPTRARRFC
jgi:hypothetical protein